MAVAHMLASACGQRAFRAQSHTTNAQAMRVQYGAFVACAICHKIEGETPEARKRAYLEQNMRPSERTTAKNRADRRSAAHNGGQHQATPYLLRRLLVSNTFTEQDRDNQRTSRVCAVEGGACSSRTPVVMRVALGSRVALLCTRAPKRASLGDKTLAQRLCLDYKVQPLFHKARAVARVRVYDAVLLHLERDERPVCRARRVDSHKGRGCDSRHGGQLCRFRPD